MMIFSVPFIGSIFSENESPPMDEMAMKSPDKRRQISAYYFKQFNKHVFYNRLPPNMAVHWNKRLLTTAGRCLQANVMDKRVAFIQLSVKILDSADRVRDTLLHEMCHAATWVLDGIQHTDHNKCFQFWAERGNRAFPELPTINSYHTYTIRTRYNYRCTKCNNRLGRHTPSLDLERTRCKLCGSRFKLTDDTSGARRTGPSSKKAAAPPGVSRSLERYVKDNLARLKRRHKNLSPSALVIKLSEDFAKSSRK